MTIDPSRVEQIARDYAAAWSSGVPANVTSFYADDGRITINRGDPIVGQGALMEMVTGFYAEFPGLVVHLDGLRTAGDHVAFLWTLEGTHAETGNRVKVPGWEEWTLAPDGKVQESLGWYDAAEYDRQVAEGI